MIHYLSKAEKERREAKKRAHVIELLKTKEVKEIVLIYPDLNSKKINQIVNENLIEFRKKKNEATKRESNQNKHYLQEF